MVNKVILIGRVSRDADLCFISQERPVASLCLATDRTWIDAEGTTHKETEWHNVIIWGKLAETSQAHLTKGRLIYVEGRLHTRGWEEAQLAKHSRTEIVVENLRYLDRPRSRHATTPEEDVPLLVRRV
jgi:single-strand DNA-binding protein